MSRGTDSVRGRVARLAPWLATAALLLAAPGAGAEAAEEADLANMVREQISRADFVDPYGITVEGEDGGRIVLRGSVANQYEKDHAGKLARAVEGVTEVDNELLVARGLQPPGVGTPPGRGSIPPAGLP